MPYRKRERPRPGNRWQRKIYHPHATARPEELDKTELLLLFVKAGDSRAALESVRHLLGPATFLMTLQNGAGVLSGILQMPQGYVIQTVPTHELILDIVKAMECREDVP